MTTETITRTETRSGLTSTYLLTVERTPASLADLDQTQRWLEQAGGPANIRSINLVKVWGRYAFDAERPLDKNYPSCTGYEVTFRSGSVGFVVVYHDHAELVALVTCGKSYLAGVYCDRKYGRRRGQNATWLRTQRSKRSYFNPDKVPDSCCAELYVRARGEGWGTELYA